MVVSVEQRCEGQGLKMEKFQGKGHDFFLSFFKKNVNQKGKGNLGRAEFFFSFFKI